MVHINRDTGYWILLIRQFIVIGQFLYFVSKLLNNLLLSINILISYKSPASTYRKFHLL